MLCPGCKTEIPEGKMYCPSCGHAIQIVPDFEPDIEEKIEIKPDGIEDLMSDAEKKAPEDSNGKTKEIPSAKDADSAITRIEKRQQQRKAKKISVWVKIVSFAALVAAGLVLFSVVRFRVQDRYS